MNVKIYKIFVGSPSDTQTEREYCKDIFKEINNSIGEKFNFRLESLMWENDARPSFGDDAQSVINRQLLLKDYHVFIGIMWARFGSTTQRAESGTIEEFEDAYKKYAAKSSVEICLYFNTSDIPQSSLDTDQFSKVNAFKKRASDLGGLYNEYKGPEKFKENLRTHLTKYFLDKHEFPTMNEETNIRSKANDTTITLLTERLNRGLTMFNGQKPHWIDPILSRTNLISSNYNDNFESRVDINELIGAPESIIIKSPPQFGLTCLANKLILGANMEGAAWIYIDAQKVKRNSMEKAVLDELNNTFHSRNIKDIQCIILDSWKNTMHGGMKILKGLSNAYKEIPIIVMQTIDSSDFLQEPESENIDRNFEVMHLLALPKTEIRKMVCSYNDEIYIDEEDKVVNKIVLDLDTLNIHRTPLNCLTLLKVAEKYFDEKTVNRTDMLDKVLNILFDYHNLPSYNSIPDVKDCEFVLGVFCEDMLKNEEYYFTKKNFISFIEKVCRENYFDIDIDTLFDVLYINGLIVDRHSEFTFRATYWLFYFAAHRMHSSQEFCSYIFDSGKYINYPEIVEFYTGIDRRRTDALEILNKDLSKTYEEVNEKLGLPDHIDPYHKIEWNPSQENIERARNEISENIQASKLPTQIKDQHSDSNKNQLRPYDQGIRKILEEYSLAILMRKITASSRALRNSDYAAPQKKKDLLDTIILSYEQVAKALIILTPELAIKGQAAYGGQSFNLDGNFGNTVDQRINKIIQEIPNNVVRFFIDDIDSEKLGPLLIKKIEIEKVQLNKHLQIILISRIRPAGWRKTVETYINQLSKNSFYLFDIMGQLRFLYFYDYISDTELAEVKQLLLLGHSKHKFGNSKPSKKVLTQFTHDILRKPKDDESI